MQNSSISHAALNGPFRLAVDEIKQLTAEGDCGVFALGQMKDEQRFGIFYVGSSYQNLRQELLDRIGTSPQFKFRLATSPEAAFLHLCELFHRFHPSGNYVHPERPKGSSLICPYCAPLGFQGRLGAKHR